MVMGRTFSEKSVKEMAQMNRENQTQCERSEKCVTRRQTLPGVGSDSQPVDAAGMGRQRDRKREREREQRDESRPGHGRNLSLTKVH